jgi:xanthine dehydrogenase YagT iron-sulfur-binding subunit
MPETKDQSSANRRQGFSRRRFLQGVGVAGVGALIVDHPLARGAQTAPETNLADGKPHSGPVEIVLNINDQDRKVTVEPRTTLLNALRNNLEPAITGPKLVCDMGTCGACTVLLDGRAVYGCLVLAIDAIGRKITTVEGLGSADHLNAVQAAFVEKDALMCGFCTPGFVTSVCGLLRENPHATEQEVREACKGNFCRCGTYPRIFEAALAVADVKSG